VRGRVYFCLDTLASAVFKLQVARSRVYNPKKVIHVGALLGSFLSQISTFLKDNLALDLHPNKVSITTLASGVDFLGWVHFPDHRVLRTSTKRQILKRLLGSPSEETT